MARDVVLKMTQTEALLESSQTQPTSLAAAVIERNPHATPPVAPQSP